MKSVKISDAEWQVMNVVWEHPSIMAVDVVTILETKAGWRPRTIRTLLDRLVQKGALKVLADGKRRYASAVNMEDCIRRESRSFIERVFGGEPASMLLHVVRDSKLSRKEIDQLKKLLSEKEK